MSKFHRFPRPSIAVTLLAVWTTLVAGCAVGPEFLPPDPPGTSTYTTTEDPSSTVTAPGKAGAAQRFDPTFDLPAQWWTLFRSEALDRLVEQALANSPTLEEAQARLVEAQELFIAKRGTTDYPTIDANLSATRKQIDLEAFGITSMPSPGPFTVYSASIDVAYTFDVFGADKRQLENLQAQIDYRRYQLEAARLTLAANVAITAIREAALRARITLIESIAAIQHRQLVIMEKRHEVGGISTLDLNRQRTLYEQTRAQLPDLKRQREQALHQLAIYMGAPPAQFQLATLEFDTLYLPERLPLTLPAELTQRRPDIRASEALWHRASADVGVATANLYPKIALFGSVGVERTRVDDLIDALNVWSLAANLVQPLFHGDELQAKKRAAVAVYEASAAAYRQTVLMAIVEVADSLRALDADARTLLAKSLTAEHAEENQRIAEEQYRSGGISHLDLLDAERQYLQTQDELIGARLNRYTDTVALLQALGGGWQDRENMPDSMQQQEREH